MVSAKPAFDRRANAITLGKASGRSQSEPVQAADGKRDRT